MYRTQKDHLPDPQHTEVSVFCVGKVFCSLNYLLPQWVNTEWHYLKSTQSNFFTCNKNPTHPDVEALQEVKCWITHQFITSLHESGRLSSVSVCFKVEHTCLHTCVYPCLTKEKNHKH